jgi:hypothetical protein
LLRKNKTVLFNVTSRTCEDAGILPHWCTCSQQKVLSSTNESVIDISK